MKTVKVTIKGTARVLDYCSKVKINESLSNGECDDEYAAFCCNYYVTVGWMDFENGGMFINDDEETDVIKQKGKYIKTRNHFHELFAAEGEHPLPVVVHCRDYDVCRGGVGDYYIELQDDEEFDIKKIQLVKSDYEIVDEPYFIIADYIMYDGKRVDECGDIFELCPDEKCYGEYEVNEFYGD